ncbi:MAG TPA: type I restriction endonuclease [Rhodanobacteraceae bacterium]|nr:type I restriction endonuclease [Rhodanobacteraceae bacterium]
MDQARDREFPVTGMPNNTGEGFVDHVLWGDDGKPLGLVEAKRTRRDARVGQQQAKLYADCLEAQLGQRPIIFYSNGYEHWIWDDNYPHYKAEFARAVTFKTEYAQSLIDAFSIKDKRPHIAISVDMPDTGIDVPEVVNPRHTELSIATSPARGFRQINGWRSLTRRKPNGLRRARKFAEIAPVVRVPPYRVARIRRCAFFGCAATRAGTADSRTAVGN